MSDIGNGTVREWGQDAALLFSPLLVFCRIALVARVCEAPYLQTIL